MLLHGRLDVLWREGGKALVLDYKTNSLAEQEPDEIVEDDYRLQRLVYALACFRAGADEVEVVYAFLERADAVVSTTFVRDEIGGLEVELSAAIARIDSGEFVPTPSEFTCSGCPARDLVCAGPRLQMPPAAVRRRRGRLGGSAELRRRGAAARRPEEGAHRPDHRAPGRPARRRADRAAVREPARAPGVGDAVGADDGREREPGHAVHCSRSTGGPRTISPCRWPSSSATSSRPASTGRRRSRCAGTMRLLIDEFDGEVPERFDDLLRLPGVARKTANVVSSERGNPQGIVVDTHVRRLSQRLGLTKQDDPVKIERDLVKLVPRSDWARFPHLLIWHGRRICDARRPRCEECPLAADLCPSTRV